MTKSKLIGTKAPAVVLRTRVQEGTQGVYVYNWQDINTRDLFKDRRVVLFALPGAFTPTCSNEQLPGYEKNYKAFRKHVDEVYCLSVNDAFTMNAWGKSLKIKNVQLLPDGSAKFTEKLGMLVAKDNLGFGDRSWRYALVINNGVIEAAFVEPGKKNNAGDDPYGESSPENVLAYLSTPIVEEAFSPRAVRKTAAKKTAVVNVDASIEVTAEGGRGEVIVK